MAVPLELRERWMGKRKRKGEVEAIERELYEEE